MLDRKKRHDLLGAVRTLGLAIQDIKDGYRFDDEYATEKIRILEDLWHLLEKELPPLVEAAD